MNRKTILQALGMCLALLCFVAPVVAQPAYDVIKLEVNLGDGVDYRFTANAINNRGEIVGQTQPLNGQGKEHAIIWREKGVQDIGTLYVDPKAASIAYDINDFGQVIGYSARPRGNNEGFVWTPRGKDGVPHNPQMRKLPSDGGGHFALPYSINDEGVIGGIIYGSGLQQAAIWRNSGLEIVPTDLLNSGVFCINSQGQYLLKGYQPGPRGKLVDFVYFNSGTTIEQISANGAASGIRVNTVNDKGEVTVSGPGNSDGFPTSFLWKSGVSTELKADGWQERDARTLNNWGEIIGRVINYPNGVFSPHAALWVKGKFYDLNDLIPQNMGVTLTEAIDINDQSWIIAQGGDSCYLLKPKKQLPRDSAVLLVHGTFGDAKTWDERMAPRLRERGYPVEAVNFPKEAETQSSQTFIELQAEALARRIWELRYGSGSPEVILVCHSMGGLAARYYLSHPELWWRTPGDPGISKLIMLGTPNWGTDAPLLNPVVTETQSREKSRSKTNDGPCTYLNWCPAVKEQFAQWQPAPFQSGSSFIYPANFKLAKWETNNPNAKNPDYRTPISPLSYIYANKAADFFFFTNPLDPDTTYSIAAIQAVIAAFPGPPFASDRSRFKPHQKYYWAKSQELGVLYPATGNQVGVDTRYVSRFLVELNKMPINLAGAKVYLIAGTFHSAKTVVANTIYIFGPFNSDCGKGGIANDGVVPVDSAQGYDPFTQNMLFPDAPCKFLPVGHSELPNDPQVVAQVVEWLNE